MKLNSLKIIMLTGLLFLVFILLPTPASAQTVQLQSTSTVVLGQDLEIKIGVIQIPAGKPLDGWVVQVVPQDTSVSYSPFSQGSCTTSGGACPVTFRSSSSSAGVGVFKARAWVFHPNVGVGDPSKAPSLNFDITVVPSPFITATYATSAKVNQEIPINVKITPNKRDVTISFKTSGTGGSLTASTCRTIDFGSCADGAVKFEASQIGTFPITITASGYAVGTLSPIEVTRDAPSPTQIPTCDPATGVTQNCAYPPGSTIYKLLAPFNGVSGGTEFNYGNENNLGNYLNMMLKIIIGISAVLAVVMIVIGGLEYMTSELVSGKEGGKNRMTQAILGLVIALGSYALLNTINPDLLKTDLVIKEATVLVELEDTPQTPIVRDGKQTYTSGDGKSYEAGKSWAEIAGESPALPERVTTNHSGHDCDTVGQQSCTSTRGLDPSILNSIRASCLNCEIIVTGGTESWLHSVKTTHRPLSSTVDLRATESLNAFILTGKAGKANFPTNNNGKKIEYKRGDITYYAEPRGGASSENHWHVYK